MKIIPTILCGGAGSRLWPVSRETHPKPFIPANPTAPVTASTQRKRFMRCMDSSNEKVLATAAL